jgi:hypothetical protein
MNVSRVSKPEVHEMPVRRPGDKRCLLLLLAMILPSSSVDAQTPDAQRAFGYLEKVCRIGKRISGTTGMDKQRQMLIQHFEALGAQVKLQPLRVTHPLNGTPVRLVNMIVSWHPTSRKRVLLACHYDTRPYPDRDRFRKRGEFLGANDGASGVALLMELGHHIRELKPRYGIDFVFFDAEEFVFSSRDKYFLGSEHFARTYRDQPPMHRYRFGVLVDMIGDKRLTVYQEKNSLKYAPSLTQSLWNSAKRAGVKEFIAKAKHEVQDDHIPLNTIADIPTCDLIDFDYRYWHTTKDLPRNCSGASLAKVGRVLLRWFNEMPAN